MSKKAEGESAPSSALLDAAFRALGHPSRRQILVSLYARGGVMAAGEIADRFKHSWPTTTRHLGVLESANLISVTKKGRKRLYTLTPGPALEAAGWIREWAQEAVDPATRPEWVDLPYATMRNAPEEPEESG